MGIVAYSLLSRTHPFYHDDPAKEENRIKTGNIHSVEICQYNLFI
jgi:hypothetical protein